MAPNWNDIFRNFPQKMTDAEVNLVRPKPWRWRKCQTTLTLEDANGSAIGYFRLSNKKPTNHYEWMRHVAAGLDTTEIPVLPDR